jgi:AraC-like DNA-binding protein
MVLRQGVDDYTLQRIRLRLETLLTDLVESARLDGVPPTRKDAKWDAEYLKIIDFMRKNLARPLTLEEIAAECSMSVSKLKLLFREKHGGGPITCLIELKIEEAKRLIEEGKMNITEIASALGFSSVHYFSRQFKKTTGMSPTDFAKKQNITAPV